MLDAFYGTIKQGHIIDSDESILLPDGEQVKVFEGKKATVYEGQSELNQAQISNKLGKEENNFEKEIYDWVDSLANHPGLRK